MAETIFLTPKGKRWLDGIRVLMAFGREAERAAEIVLRKEILSFEEIPEKQRRASIKVFAALAKMDVFIGVEGQPDGNQDPLGYRGRTEG